MVWHAPTKVGKVIRRAREQFVGQFGRGHEGQSLPLFCVPLSRMKGAIKGGIVYLVAKHHHVFFGTLPIFAHLWHISCFICIVIIFLPA